LVGIVAVTGSGEHDNEPSASVKDGRFLKTRATVIFSRRTQLHVVFTVLHFNVNK
jgi:hypothetical protein